MGTRNLTVVKMDGKVKIAQYCQWDGYPTGTGTDIAKFIHNKLDMRKFKSALKKVRFASTKEIQQKTSTVLGHDNNLITLEEGDLLARELPAFSRDTGAKVLSLVQAGEVTELRNDYNFRKDTLSCEYAYTIDLDKKTVSVSFGWRQPKTVKYSFEKFTAKAMKELEDKINGNDS